MSAGTYTIIAAVCFFLGLPLFSVGVWRGWWDVEDFDPYMGGVLLGAAFWPLLLLGPIVMGIAHGMHLLIGRWAARPKAVPLDHFEVAAWREVDAIAPDDPE
jgi:hypothetical protein